MAATMAEIRQGIANNLASLEGVQVSPYMLANSTLPAIHIFPSAVSYDQAMHRGVDAQTMTVQAMVAFGSDQGAQVTLDELLAPSGSRSVKAAIESDKTLGGKVQDVWVQEAGNYVITALPESRQILSVNWTVLVRS
jgi:hypothetical protein